MNHKDLDVWKASIDLAVMLYGVTKQFPKDESYNLTSQIRRAGTSIASNIAEGAARNGDKEFIQFLYIALGSLAEVETQLIIANKLGHVTETQNIFECISSLKQMILGLIKYLKGKGK